MHYAGPVHQHIDVFAINKGWQLVPGRCFQRALVELSIQVVHIMVEEAHHATLE